MTTTRPAFVAYLRVSTDDQGRSGLGLEAQRAAIVRHANTTGAQIIAEFVEVQSGGDDSRPQLAAARSTARLHKVPLIVSTLDRLSRRAGFIHKLIDDGAQFVAADDIDADTFRLGLKALLAEQEREKISQRTRAALAAAKARGVKLGGDRGTVPPPHAAAASAAVRTANAKQFACDAVNRIDRSLSFQANADRLNAAGLTTTRGKQWTATAVRRVVLAATA